jgi:hypothetical protein
MSLAASYALPPAPYYSLDAIKMFIPAQDGKIVLTAKRGNPNIV